jgi:porphobilinogen synthase
MAKPAIAYLDVWRIRQRFDHPLAAYNVSGETSIIKGGVH